jgi:hypothetical protein
MATIRATSFVWVNNASSGTVALPAGAAAGDSLLLFVGHGYQVNTPTGFTLLENTNQGFYNGGVYQKILVAADITAGNVTVTFAGVYYGHIVAVCFVGTFLGFRTWVQTFTTGGAASRTITTDASPANTEMALCFGAGRCNGAITSSVGTVLTSNANNQSSFVLAEVDLVANGAVSDTFGYAVVPTGDYQTIVVVSDLVSSPAQVDDVGVEILRDGSPVAQTQEVGVEVLRGGVPAAQIDDIGVEVLRSVTSVVRRRPVFLIENIIEDAGVVYSADTLFVDGDPVFVDTATVEFS